MEEKEKEVERVKREKDGCSRGITIRYVSVCVCEGKSGWEVQRCRASWR